MIQRNFTELYPSVQRLTPLSNEERYSALTLGLMVMDGKIKLNTTSGYRIGDFDYADDVVAKRKRQYHNNRLQRLRLRKELNNGRIQRAYGKRS